MDFERALHAAIGGNAGVAMNPWGLLILALGVLLLIMGITGSYTKVKTAILGH